MVPRISSGVGMRRLEFRGLRLVAALTLTLSCVLMVDGRSRGAEAQTRLEQSALPHDVSAARRWGGRNHMLGRRGRTADRGGPRQRGKIVHGRRGTPDDERPGGPPHAPDGKPDPHDHARNDDRNRSETSQGGADRPPGHRDPDPRPRPTDGAREPGPDHVLCIGGRVRNGGCTCDGARVRVSREQRAFRCPHTPTLAALSGTPQGPLRFDPGGPLNRLPQTPPAGRPGNLAVLDAFVPDEVLVTVARTTPISTDDAVAQSHGLELIERRAIALIDRRVVRYRIAGGRPVAALLAALRADPRVLDPQPNHYYRAQQDGSSRGRPVGLQYALSKLEAVRAQTLASGRGALVAVIDTGVDETHPDLAGATIESFDAVEGMPNSDPHGTAIAGIIAANGILRGVAPAAKLLDVRAFAPAGAARVPAATTLNLLRGMEWALARRARVLNMSFAGPKDGLLERGIAAAGERGAIIVAAAGNGGAKAPFAYPAAYPQVIAVTAIDFADRGYAEANHGRYIAVAAPGVDVLTASADHAHRLQSGTSFAAAHVSGIVALLLERDPGLTADAARRALMTTSHDLGPPGADDQFGAGRPDAFAALGLLARR